MAICRMCHKSVPNGVDFCDECKVKMMNQADESYLDSLLSSVSGNSAKKAPKTEEIPQNDNNTTAPEIIPDDVSFTGIVSDVPEMNPADEGFYDAEEATIDEASIEEPGSVEDAEEAPLLYDSIIDEPVDFEQVSDDLLIPEDVSVSTGEDAAPAVEDFSAYEEAPASEDTAVLENASELGDIAGFENEPDTAALPDYEDTSVIENMPASEELSGFEDTPIIEDVSGFEDAPVSEDISAFENTQIPAEELDFESRENAPSDELSELLSGNEAVSDNSDISIDDLLASLSEGIPEDSSGENTEIPDTGIDGFLINEPDEISDDVTDPLDVNLNEPILDINELQSDSGDIPQIDDIAQLNDISPLDNDFTQSDFEDIQPILEGIQSEMNEQAGDTDYDVAGEEPINAEQIIEKPAIGEPVFEEQISDAPVIEEPIIGESVIEEPVMEEPVIEEPIIEEPAFEEQYTEQPLIEEQLPEGQFETEALAEEPVFTDQISEEINPDEQISDGLVTDEPVSDGLITDEPISDGIITDEPITDDLIADEPITDGLITDEAISDGTDGSFADEQIADIPLTDELSADEALPDAPIIDESISDDLITDEQITDEPIIDEPTTYEPISEETINDEPVSDEPISEEPINDEPVSDEPTGDSTDTELPEETSDSIDNDAVYDSNEDMDELLSSLLEDMDNAKKDEGPAEAPIEADDIESIFNNAEEMINPGSDDTDTEGSDAEGSDLFDNKDSTDIDAILDESGLDLTSEDLEKMAGGDSQPEDNGIEGIDIGIGAGMEGSDNPDGPIVSEDIDALFSEVEPGEGSKFLSEEDLENSLNGQGEGSIDDLITEIDTGGFEERIKNLSSSDDNKEAKKTKKKSWFMRLFGNIKEELTPEQIKERQEKAKAEEEAKKKAAEAKKKKAELSKEEKEAKKAEAKAAAAEAAKKKAEEKKRKAAEAKEKAKKKKEERLAIEEFEADEGKINKAGATVLFVIFAAMTIFIIVGTNIYSYNLSIKNAQEDFEVKMYNEAYYEVYGLKVKDEHIDLYDKIMTVQYVNSELNSYEYYMYSNNREKALDSLLKGLQRYDKYFELASRLGIKDDLAYVKSKILEKLSTEFQLTESEAYQMLAIRDDIDYSEYLYTLLGTYDIELTP